MTDKQTLIPRYPADASRRLECRTCHGSCEILVGWTDGTMLSPPDPVWDECPVCFGTGSVRQWELDEEFGGVFPSQAEAAEILEERRMRRAPTY